MNITVYMKIQSCLTGSISYEEEYFILPDKWTFGNLVDHIISYKLENAERILDIGLEVINGLDV